MTNPSRKDWRRLLEDALWAHRIACRTPLGMSPYWIVFGKTCHLLSTKLTRLSNSAIWPMIKLRSRENSNYKNSEERPSSRLESAAIQLTTKAHSRWDGPFVIINIIPYGAVQLKDEKSNNTFQVNRPQIKPFYEGPIPIVDDIEIISLMELAPLDGIT
ncbi:hypothetical protein CR513_14278, partial [Mucuna pruriens]